MGNNSLNFTNISDSDYNMNIAFFKNKITAFLWVEKSDLLFLGD